MNDVRDKNHAKSLGSNLNILEAIVHKAAIESQNFGLIADFRRLVDQEKFFSEQAKIAAVAKADPKNIQEVGASQLAIINSYYQSGLQQSQQSFRWSLIWGSVGFSFLVVAVTILLFRQPTEVAVASSIAGALVEIFAGTYLYLYKHASDQLAQFRKSLDSTQRLLLANSMCEQLEGDAKQAARTELIKQVGITVASGDVLQSQEAKPNVNT